MKFFPQKYFFCGFLFWWHKFVDKLSAKRYNAMVFSGSGIFSPPPIQNLNSNYAPLAKLDIASVYGKEGRVRPAARIRWRRRHEHEVRSNLCKRWERKLNSNYAPLAKLDIASVYGTEGQEFESLTVHQLQPIIECGCNFLFFVLKTWKFYILIV